MAGFVSVRGTGFRTDVTSVMAGVQRSLTTQARRKEKAIGELILDYIRDRMYEPKSGKMHVVKDPKTGQSFTYQASAPGEYPAIKFGYLASNRHTYVVQTSSRTLLGTEMPYGKDLEQGWTYKGAMLIRPWLNRGYLESVGEITKLLSGKWTVTVR